MKIDPYKHKERYFNWKKKTEKGILGISNANSDLIKRFMSDMEFGLNVSVKSKKGARSYIRLNTLRDKMTFFARLFEEKFNLSIITKITEQQIHSFFADMRNGIMKRKDGREYKAPSYFVKSFKSFWHWYMLIQKKEGKEVEDITIYLDTKEEKPEWVYLSEEDVKKLCNKAKYEYKVLMMFLFDSGIRSPTELLNIRVGDFYEDFKKLQIRDEVSKTFGRKINLLLCSKLIKDYVQDKNLKESDCLFPISSFYMNRYLKNLAKRVLGNKKTLAGGKYGEITTYDFRHSSACYWLPRYKSESALKYRFGWKKSEMIHYYTELLGMKDTITEEDMLIDLTKTEIEKRLDKSESDKVLLQEKIKIMERQMAEITQVTKELYGMLGMQRKEPIMVVSS